MSDNLKAEDWIVHGLCVGGRIARNVGISPIILARYLSAVRQVRTKTSLYQDQILYIREQYSSLYKSNRPEHECPVGIPYLAPTCH